MGERTEQAACHRCGQKFASACTIRLAQVLDDSAFLMTIPRAFIYVAYAAWLSTFVGLLHYLFKSARYTHRS